MSEIHKHYSLLMTLDRVWNSSSVSQPFSGSTDCLLIIGSQVLRMDAWTWLASTTVKPAIWCHFDHEFFDHVTNLYSDQSRLCPPTVGKVESYLSRWPWRWLLQRSDWNEYSNSFSHRVPIDWLTESSLLCEPSHAWRLIIPSHAAHGMQSSMSLLLNPNCCSKCHNEKISVSSTIHNLVLLSLWFIQISISRTN